MEKDGRTISANGEAVRTEITREDFERVHPKLLRRFQRLGASHEDALDMAQETLLIAHRKLHTYEGRAELDTWILTIGKSVRLQRRRASRTEKRGAEAVPLETVEVTPLEPASGDNVERRAIARERLSRARRAIARLPEKMREPLLLHLDGQKYKEIGALLHIPEGRVASLIHQAREKLRREPSG